MGVTIGIMNVRALQEVMDGQTLAYAFPFSQFSFPTDISCIILSEGRKSAFFKVDVQFPDFIFSALTRLLINQTDLTIPLKLHGDGIEATNLYRPVDRIRIPEKNMLDEFRNLVVSARHGKVRVGESTSEVSASKLGCLNALYLLDVQYIQQDFVSDRQRNKAITSDDLIRRMAVAR